MSHQHVLAAASVLAALLGLGCAGSTPPPTAAQAAQLCVGVPEADARAGLAGMQPAIEGVEPLVKKVQMGRSVFSERVGATVYVRATPGVTQQWIGRVLACHHARYAASPNTPAAEADPLALSDVNTSVASTETGFAVEIRSRNSDEIKEILRRAEPLAYAKPAALAQSSEQAKR